MNKLKDKLINSFFEEYNNEVKKTKKLSSKLVIRRILIASTIVINFILNILYVSLFCYSGTSKNINSVVFIVSFIWTIISLISSYKLDGKYSKLLFYLNILIIVFISKLWFVYL